MSHGNVLVVEDDDTIRRLLVEYLKQHSFLNVHGARDGVEALHCVSTRHYAVVILDLMLPHMSGVDFLNSLEAMLAEPSLGTLGEPPEVVIITGIPADDVHVETMLERHPRLVKKVFRKPVDILGLVGWVERATTAAPRR